MTAALFNHKKNRLAPAMLIAAPITCRAVIFSLNINADGTMINIGTSAINVEAMPVSVCCTA